MKLYYAAGACSVGIHLILEEIGKPYSAQTVSFADREQYGEAYRSINPKSKVPALQRDDGSVLTEFPAIAIWLASTAPEKALMPTDPEGFARVLEAMDYIVATLHMQGFARLFRPANFSSDEREQEAVKARGREIIGKAFGLLSENLEGREYLLGAFSIADAALFYTEFWALKRVGLPVPDNCKRHFETMLSRPAVKAALAKEGLAGA